MSIFEPITTEEMRLKIRRRLGEPVVRVELTDDQIDDAISDSVQRFIRDATGQATSETFFTLQLSSGVNLYQLPAAVIEVIEYDDESMGGGMSTGTLGPGGINTLFSVENYMYQQGMFDPVVMAGSGGGGGAGGLISYKIAMGFLKDMKNMFPSQFTSMYHPYKNQLEILPTPYIGGNGTCMVLLRTQCLEGTALTDTTKNYEYFFTKEWVFLYALAKAKQTLGMVRRKFSNFQSIGNTGISLDGDTLVNEANQELDALEKRLYSEEAWSGYGISLGSIM